MSTTSHNGRPLSHRQPSCPLGGVKGFAPFRGTETLLFAEDDPVLRKLTGRILEQAGYTVLYATDGVEAVRLFQDHSNRVAAAVLDILMPRMTGDAALRHMRELRPELRAVYVTGYCDYAGLDAEAPLLQKPVATADLLATLRAVLDGVLVGR